MKLTYADALLHLPVDPTLRAYLSREGLVLPADFDWSDDAITSNALIAQIQAYPDSDIRDKVVAGGGCQASCRPRGWF